MQLLLNKNTSNVSLSLIIMSHTFFFWGGGAFKELISVHPLIAIFRTQIHDVITCIIKNLTLQLKVIAAR